MEGFKDGCCGHVFSQAAPVDYGVREIQVLTVVCPAVGYRVGEWMDPAGCSYIGLLGWCILVDDGDQSMVKLVEV